MVTIDRLKSIDDLKYADAYEEVKNLSDGKKYAIAFFKEIHDANGHDGAWNDEVVQFYGPKKFRRYDNERGVTVETYVYESYIDSGSVDYFLFSFEIDL